MGSAPRKSMTDPVSRETIEKLTRYHALLLKWQRTINLVSPNTIPEAWERHFLDSLQILPLLPNGTITLFDFGSGGGFPGLVLACARDDIAAHLVESDQRKCSFMRTVSRETNTKAIVHNVRIELFESDLVPDVVTARALASLTDLCGYILPWADRNPSLQIILQKGQNHAQEIADAQTQYSFSCNVHESQYGENSAILVLSNLCKRDS